MTDPAVKTAIAICVILGGVCAALLFRHDRPRPISPDVNADAELLLRCRGNAPATRPTTRLREWQAPPPDARPATVVTPLDRHEPPPALSPDYPESGRSASSRWGVSMDMMLPVAALSNNTARTHTIVDGDTLAALAERYLGSAERAEEIFRANRDVLSDPKLLPIGLELKLPTRDDRTTPQTPLVPVR